VTATLLAIGALGGLWVGGLVAYIVGHAFGVHRGRRQARKEWQALCDELEGENDILQVELTKALATVQDLNHNIGTAFDAGIVQGQILQAERQENGL
jgi:hypothetical protein